MEGIFNAKEHREEFIAAQGFTFLDEPIIDSYTIASGLFFNITINFVDCQWGVFSGPKSIMSSDDGCFEHLTRHVPKLYLYPSVQEAINAFYGFYFPAKKIPKI